jgi:hypothetical protein
MKLFCIKACAGDQGGGSRDFHSLQPENMYFSPAFYRAANHPPTISLVIYRFAIKGLWVPQGS